MTKVSYRNLSLLGLVLMGASAVTAAILPKSPTKVFANGHIEISTVGAPDNSCKGGWATGQVKCDFTASNVNTSVTSINGALTSGANGGSTLATNTGNLPDASGTLVTTP